MFSATKSMAGAMCINVVDSSQEVCCPIHPGITNWKKPSFHCGRKAWQVLSVLRLRRLLCLFRLAPSCRLRRLARWCEMAEMVSTATQPRYATAMFQSLSLLVSPARTSRQRQTRRPRLLFSVSAKCLHERQQQQEARRHAGTQGAATTGKQ